MKVCDWADVRNRWNKTNTSWPKSNSTTNWRNDGNGTRNKTWNWEESGGAHMFRRALSFDERLGIEWSIRVTSVLSAIGCLYIMYRFFARKKQERDITSLLVMVLAGYELVIAIAKFPALDFLPFEVGPKGYYLPWGHSPGTLCQVQAFFIDVFMTQAVIWNGCMALNLLRWVVYRDIEETLQSRFWIYFFATSFFSVAWGLSGSFSIWLDPFPDPRMNCTKPAEGLFGYSKYYCWIQDPDWIVLRYIPFVVLVLVIIVAVMVKIRFVIVARARQFGATSDDVVNRIQRRLVLYVVTFLVLYTPITVYRLMCMAEPQVRKEDKGSKRIPEIAAEFGVVAQALMNLQGFVNAVIYGGLGQGASPARKHSMSSQDHPSSVFLEDVRSGVSATNATLPSDGISIFASTFNMAEGALPSVDEIAKWIPQGHTIYLIGLQECLNLAEMRKAIAAYLEAVHGKSFVEYGREIGRTETKMGYHGLIAVTVYVCVDDVQAGLFYMHQDAPSKVNRGVNLMGLGRASNKGAVGFAFRYFDSTFAVVSCHMTSDSSGKSKVKKRHQDGTSILSDMHLQSIGNEFDCHLMAHHTIFMGDLNYRLTAQDASPDQILNMVTSIVNTTRRTSSIKRGQIFTHHELLPKGFRRSSIEEDKESMYVLTSTPLSAFHPSSDHDLEGGLTPLPLRSSEVLDSSTYSGAMTPSVVDTISWNTLLEHDELKRSMDDGIVFHDFDEARISFAPTYRRVLGTMLDLSHAWTADQLTRLYTTSLGEHKVRVPSYTDRILFHSLPDLRDRFACVHYTSAEFIATSDHKPVSSIFEVLVDKQPQPERSPQSSRIPLSRRQKDTRAASLKRISIHFSNLQLTWGPALETFTSDDSSEESTSTAPTPHHHAATIVSDSRSSTTSTVPVSSTAKPPMKPTAAATIPPTAIEGLRVRSVFPLPCEDELAEERQLMEVADHLLPHNPTTSHGNKLKPTWKVSEWSVLAEHGLKQSVLLAQPNQLHAALKFLTPAGATAGQGIVSLADASGRCGRKVDFVTFLTVGGRRTGKLMGKVSLSMDKM
ncbi:Aste57867_20143 [Aphanomyces stellatus]|uniref:Aste57867_20143 protein n=1 Tax=Aphanomyces stellatus TaxID=120398 RepID=A0A485LG91_9STRA|nr:hypothetical protein As57867_020077 [Aphanomyces stellatus]VFT96838.1 Aste57867_20143 [Aphanomyces stellatus]